MKNMQMIPYFLLESVELLFLGELEGKKNLDIKSFLGLWTVVICWWPQQ